MSGSSSQLGARFLAHTHTRARPCLNLDENCLQFVTIKLWSKLDVAMMVIAENVEAHSGGKGQEGGWWEKDG